MRGTYLSLISNPCLSFSQKIENGGARKFPKKTLTRNTEFILYSNIKG